MQIKSCKHPLESILKHLGVDRIDLYSLAWQGFVLTENIDCFSLSVTLGWMLPSYLWCKYIHAHLFVLQGDSEVHTFAGCSGLLLRSISDTSPCLWCGAIYDLQPWCCVSNSIDMFFLSDHSNTVWGLLLFSKEDDTSADTTWWFRLFQLMTRFLLNFAVI